MSELQFIGLRLKNTFSVDESDDNDSSCNPDDDFVRKIQDLRRLISRRSGSTEDDRSTECGESSSSDESDKERCVAQAQNENRSENHVKATPKQDASNVCPSCSGAIRATFKFCPYCGAAQVSAIR